MSNPKAISLLHEALLHHKASRLDRALALYAQVLSLDPGNAEALQFSGSILLQKKQLPQALLFLTKALNKNPGNVSCAIQLGQALHTAGRNEHARQVLEHALAKDPKQAEAWTLLTGVFKALGKTQEMLLAAGKLVETIPEDGDALARLGELVYDAQGWAAAVPHFRKASVLSPKQPMVWVNLGICLINLKDLTEADSCFDKALKLAPSLAKAHAGKAIVHERSYRLNKAIESFRRAIKLDPTAADNRSCMLMNLHYFDDIDRMDLVREHRDYGTATLVPDLRPPARKLPGPGEGLIRVGFLSPDFRAHSVAYFIEPLLRHLDRSRFEIILYHDHAICDWMTEGLRPLASLWRHTAGQPHEIVVKQLREDKLDLLFDLTGHTGFNRLQLFAQGLAPVQATYLGYPDTTGLPAMNFRISDTLADPPGDSEALCTETLIRMPRTAWCYTPHPKAPEPQPPPCLTAPGGQVTFGCFNNYSKVTDKTLRVWGHLLASLPGSKLLLKNHGLDTPGQREQEHARFARARLDPAQVELLGRMEKMEDHLASYHRVDISLDTFPYNGTTTTCEALWMGVPVVNLTGDRHASRVGASLLHAAGHPEWVTSCWEGYEDACRALATDPARLSYLRPRLRQQLQASALCDHPGQAADFGALILQMLGLSK